MSATACPISRSKFFSSAKPIALSNVLASPKQFSTQNFGWSANEKQTLVVDGVPIRCQVNVNITAINSKDAPEV